MSRVTYHGNGPTHVKSAVHTVMHMRLISEESWKIVYSCPRPQNGSTEGDLN